MSHYYWHRGFEVAGATYRFWAVDTNVVSEMLKDPKGTFKAVLERTLDQRAIMGLSIWTIFELRRRSDLFDLFRSYFGRVPFGFLKSPNDLFDEEVRAYARTTKTVPSYSAFSPLNPAPEDSLDYVLEKLFREPQILEAERAWNSGWKEDGLSTLLSLKKNFSPRGDRYNAEDGERFIKIAVPQFVSKHAPKLAGRLKIIEPDEFPSLKMCLWTVFFRFYAEERKPQPQDAFDIFNSGVTPYVDGVLTEKFQAEIVRKTKKRERTLKHVEVFTLRDFRS